MNIDERFNDDKKRQFDPRPPYTVHSALCTIHYAQCTMHHTLCTMYCAGIPDGADDKEQTTGRGEASE